MAIDSAEPPDAVRRDPGPASADRADLMRTDPEYRATVHRLYRALVDHVYGQAHDAWVRALPDLRAVWEKQEEKYPERSRATARTQPDGAWLGDGDRRLTPDQNAEATRACTQIREQGLRVIGPALERIEAADPTRRLAGRQHMLKGEDRLKEKVADYVRTPGITVGIALDRVPDAVRFTFAYPPQRYAEGTLSDVERLRAEGFELIKLKNLWADAQYKGINSQWRERQTGLRFEVQFHTEESLAAKELTHKAYERIRGLVSSAERQEHEAYQRQVNTFLVIPAGTAEIRDYPEKND